AFDLGASNGRAILGRFDGEKIVMQELHRFENNYVGMGDVQYWDLPYLYSQIKQGFLAFRRGEFGNLDCFGIDTWGVDYGLLDHNGNLLSNPRAYRMAQDADMEAVWETVGFPTLFARTGISGLNFNTIYQLARRKREGDAALSCAETLLLMPDLLGYFLTGEKRSEYTNVTTTMLYHPQTRDWDWETIAALGLPKQIFTPIDRAGQLRGRLLPALAEEFGLNRAPFAAVGTHDTASAVAAVPGKGSFAFCSSGTWSLFGMETDAPLLQDGVRDAHFSNEGTVQGGFRPLRNIMGLWIIQECRRDWQKAGQKLSWEEIGQAARQTRRFRSIIDPDDTAFFAAGNMERKIQEFCRSTGQPVPETVGEVARCIYESLALKYRSALEGLEAIKGARIDSLNIVGGGIQNRLLSQMAADALDRPVVTGPIEGAAMGNLLTQAMALGEIANLEELRQVVRNSTEVETYAPSHTQDWEDAYGRLRALMK
ncbi:MAG: rhamnulokinase family protein, partial [Oscillospiraceae bacterium]|nr:rhamnulokinase family protein [Oscillospiraceae bacterium]